MEKQVMRITPINQTELSTQDPLLTMHTEEPVLYINLHKRKRRKPSKRPSLVMEYIMAQTEQVFEGGTWLSKEVPSGIISK